MTTVLSRLHQHQRDQRVMKSTHLPRSLSNQNHSFSIILRVLPGSPAFQAQLRIGDLIIKAHSIDIFSYDDATTVLIYIYIYIIMHI